jgi:VWFA-related protein
MTGRPSSALAARRRRRPVWPFATSALFIIFFTACILHAQQSGTQTAPAPTSPAPQTQKSQTSSTAVPESSGKVSVETKMVTLYATVRDKHGKIVPTLNKENFALTEDEHPQTISYFVRETDLPLTLGLLVDTSMSQANVLDNERTASFTFLDHMMREDEDHAFVIHFDREVELLQDVTQSKPKLQAALQLLSVSQSDSSSQTQSGGGQGQRRGGGSGTHLYDAIYLASHDVISSQKGRKAIFVLTDGVDRGSKETLEEAIEAAQRADTAVYALYFPGTESSFGRGYGHGGGMGRGGGWPGGGYPGGHRGGYPQEERIDGKKVLEKLTTETGGQLFEISKKLPIDQAYAEAEEELRNQYSLGYTPSPADTDAGYHRIKLTVDQKDDSVQARDGYYSD